MSRPKLVLTGGSGYLGSKISEALSNEFEITSIDLLPSPSPVPGVHYVLGSILDEPLLREAMLGAEYVINAAAMVPLTKSDSGFRSVNEIGARNVAEAARDSGTVSHFVHISSSAVFGKSQSGAIAQGAKRLPLEPYGVSKMKGEDNVLRALNGSNVGIAIIRPRTILGPDRGGIFDLFFSWILEGKPVFTIGPGDKLFQFVHVEDLIDAILVVVSQKASGEFNVGAQAFGTLDEVFKQTIAVANSGSRIVHLPVIPTIAALWILEKLKLSPLAPWHYRTFHYEFHFDLAPLLILGWRSKYSNEDMFRAAIESYASDSRVHSSSGSSPHTAKLDAKFLRWLQKLWG